MSILIWLLTLALIVLDWLDYNSHHTGFAQYFFCGVRSGFEAKIANARLSDEQ